MHITQESDISPLDPNINHILPVFWYYSVVTAVSPLPPAGHQQQIPPHKPGPILMPLLSAKVFFELHRDIPET